MARLVKKFSKFIAITIFTVYCLVWLLSPVIVNYVVNSHALPKGYSLTSDSSIRYNPFTSHLSINDLEMQLDNQGVTFKLKEVDAELHLHQLLFEKIYIAEFNVNGMYIPVTVSDTSLNVAGFELMDQQGAESETVEELEEPKQKQPKSAYQLVVPKFKLTDARFEIQHLGVTHNVQFDSLLLENIRLSQQAQDLQLLLMSKINDAPLSLRINSQLIQQRGLVNITLNVDEFALRHLQTFLPEGLAALKGELSYASELNVELSQEATLVNFNKFFVSLNDFHVEQDNLSVDVSSQIIESDDVSIVLLPESPVGVNGLLNSSTSGVLVSTMLDDGQLAKIDNIGINDIAVNINDNVPLVDVSNVIITDSVFSQHITQDMPALASFKQLAINNINYQADGVAVGDISLSGLVAHLLLDEDKQLSTLVSLTDNSVSDNEQLEAAEQDDSNSESQSNEPKTQSQMAFSLGKFSLADNATIEFKDSSVSPHYERNVDISVLSLTAVDSKKPDLESVFNLEGKSDKYANFVVEGRGHPFAETQTYNIDALIKEVSLPSVSSYIKDALKYEIESGQLDVVMKAGLKGSEIAGDVDLLLRGVEFTAADDHEAGTVTDQTSVPFNVALGMLKDSDGNVELSVPLSGDTSSPSFGFTGFLTLLVKQATMSAAKEYLITTFVPYASVMKVAMAAGQYALKLRINDLNYLPKQIELTPAQIEFSRQMSVMLQDKADINVKLCAISTPADIAVSSAEEAHLANNVVRLKAISKQRVETFKAYMVEKLNVTSAKLLLCTPQIDTSKGAKSRIEFVI